MAYLCSPSKSVKMENFLYVVPVLGVVGLLYMALKAKWVTAQDAGDSKMQGIATAIAEGAMAFCVQSTGSWPSIW